MATKEKHLNNIEELMKKNPETGAEEAAEQKQMAFSISGPIIPDEEKDNKPEKQTGTEKKTKGKSNSEYFGFRIDENLYGKLLTLSEQTGFRMSDLIRQAIGTALRNYEEKNGELKVTRREDLEHRNQVPVL